MTCSTAYFSYQRGAGSVRFKNVFRPLVGAFR